MNLSIGSQKDMAAGLFFLVIGTLGIWLGWELPMGMALRMGPGYVPKGLSGILIILGVFIGARAIAINGRLLNQWVLHGLGVLVNPLYRAITGRNVAAAGTETSAAGEDDGRLESWKLRPLVIISGSILLFGYIIDDQGATGWVTQLASLVGLGDAVVWLHHHLVGLIFASLVIMIVSTMAGREMFWRETIIFAVIMSIGSAVLFERRLGLSMRISPDWAQPFLGPIIDTLDAGLVFAITSAVSLVGLVIGGAWHFVSVTVFGFSK
jgi:hypothetical protein